MNEYSECYKSKNRKHEIIFPRFEDSLDKNIKRPEPYCKNCFKKMSEIEQEPIKIKTEN